MKTKIFLGFILFAIAGYMISACVKDDVYVGPPTIEKVLRTPLAPGATDDVTITADISDLKGIKSAKLYYKNSPTADFVALDMTAGAKPSYSAVIPAQPLDTVVAYYIEAINVSNLIALYPSNAPTSTQIYTVGAPAIVMNEIFSRGVAGNLDWVELYNSSSTPVDISGYKIYDAGGQSGSKPKMEIPNGTSIAAKGYYVITVDDPATANPEGSSFGLSSSGDEVWLESAAGFEIDHQVVPAMPVATTSYGRTTDGGSTWDILTTVTKNAPNSASAPSISGMAISPTAPKSTDAVVVSATITDAQGLSTIKLYYKVNSGSYSSINMTHVGDVYSGTIPAQVAASVVSYYIEAVNTVPLTSYSPVTAPTTPSTYTVAAPPAISDLAISPLTPGATDNVVVSATFIDPLGFSSIKLYYKIGSGSYSNLTMTNTSGNVYSATIPAQVATTEVSYYVEAVNTLSLTSVAPATAPATPATYTVSSLSSITGMAISPLVPTPSDVVTVSATITDIQGVTSAELYYKIGLGSYSTVTMSHSGDIYSGDIPAQSAGDVISYYIKVTNASSLITYSPADALTTPATYTVASAPNVSNLARLPLTPTADNRVTVSVTVDNLLVSGIVKLYYKVDAGSYSSLTMTAAGNVSNAVIPAQGKDAVVSYYVEAKNSETLVSLLPVDALSTPETYTVGASAIVMNEIQSRGIVGDPDWIEVYNTSGSAIDISGYKIYDSGGNSGSKPKMLFPNGTTIPAHGYVVIVVDDAASANPAGSNFGLSSSGEQVWFANIDGAVIDTITFGVTVDATQSYGRTPDGGTWGVLTTVTKGTANP